MTHDESKSSSLRFDGFDETTAPDINHQGSHPIHRGFNGSFPSLFRPVQGMVSILERIRG